MCAGMQVAFFFFCPIIVMMNYGWCPQMTLKSQFTHKGKCCHYLLALITSRRNYKEGLELEISSFKGGYKSL